MPTDWWAPSAPAQPKYSPLTLHHHVVVHVDGETIWLDSVLVAGLRQNFAKMIAEHGVLHDCLLDMIMERPLSAFPLVLGGLAAATAGTLVAAQVVRPVHTADGEVLHTIPRNVAAAAKHLHIPA